MNITTLLLGKPSLILDEFRHEVDLIYYSVSDMRRPVCDVADDVRIAAARMVTALCMSRAREFRIIRDGSGNQTLIVWAKGEEGWPMSADAVEYVRTFRNCGEAWEALAGILVRGGRISIHDCPGNRASALRGTGQLEAVIDSLSEPGTVIVLEGSEAMSYSPKAFCLLFGGDVGDWKGDM